MDSKKILEKYLKPAAALKIIGWVLVVASVAMLLMGILSAGSATSEAGDPVKFHTEDTKKGTYAYIDVVGISSWLIKDDGKVFYVAMDKHHNGYVVRVGDSDYNKMDDQYDYFMDEDAVMPKAYTLDGVAKEASKQLRKDIAECVGIASYEYEDYFGIMYLDATTTPGDDAFAMWLVGFILCLILGIVFLLITLPASMNFKKCIANLEERGLLDMAAAELQGGEYEQVGKDCGRLTRQFFFGKNSGMVLPYSDIQWLYRQNVKRNFITVAVNLIVSTNKLNQKVMLTYNGRNRDEELNKVFMAVAQHNPNVLLGYSSENQKEYKARKNAAKLG